jgi:putative transposase
VAPSDRRVSNTLDAAFCNEATEPAQSKSQPELFNSDQCSEFTSEAFTSRLIQRRVAISIYVSGRALDDVMIERLW